jgi:type IV secretory pathway VirB2 component (pilin)
MRNRGGPIGILHSVYGGVARTAAIAVLIVAAAAVAFAIKKLNQFHIEGV